MNHLSKSPANASLLQQEVQQFFSNQTPAQVEQDLYDMLQHSLENEPEPHACKNRLHTYRELTQFMQRIYSLL